MHADWASVNRASAVIALQPRDNVQSRARGSRLARQAQVRKYGDNRGACLSRLVRLLGRRRLTAGLESA